jgi:hypothetical protein
VGGRGALSRVELEDDSADLDVVAGLEARRLERADHAHAVQATLDVGHRLVVVDVEARQQAFYRRPADAEGALPRALDPPPTVGGGPEDAVLGELLLGGMDLGLRRSLDRDPPQQLA